MVPLDSALKASFIFAPGFKRFVEADLGWPLLVVIPCRDFIYIISQEDDALLSAMGIVVQREFRESGYRSPPKCSASQTTGSRRLGTFQNRRHRMTPSPRRFTLPVSAKSPSPAESARPTSP
jgi:hypothetical protein